MKTIIVVNPSSVVGGPTVALLNLLKQAHSTFRFEVLGVEPALRQFQGAGFASTTADVRGMQRAGSLADWSDQATRLLSGLPSVVRLVSRRDVVGVYTNGETYWAANAVGRALGKPTITHAHASTAVQGGAAGAAVGRILNTLSDRIFVVADWVRPVFERAGLSPSKIRVVKNGVNVERFSPRTAGAKSADGPLVVGMVANLEVRKGHVRFAEAARMLARKGCSAEFRIIGLMHAPNAETEKYRERLVSIANDPALRGRLRLVGAREAMADEYRALDMLVVPSDVEACPVAPIEAMACGLPVVATNVPGNEEAIPVPKAGLLVPRDPGAIADAVAMLCENHELRRSMGLAARTHVVKEYNIENTARAFVRELNEVFGGE